MSLLAYELEQAFVSLILPTLLDGNVYGGRSPGDRTLPNVVCDAIGEAEEDPKLSGNFWMVMRITCKSSAATEPAGFDPTPLNVAFVQSAFNAVLVDNLPALINAQGRTLTMLPNGYITGAPRTEQDAEGAWVDVLEIRCYCCASVLAA